MTTPAVLGHIELPDHFLATQQERQAIASVINSRLDYDVDIRFQMDRHPFRAVLYETQQCPVMVPFADWRETFEAYKPGEIFIGVDKTGAPYKSSFLTDDPHWGFEVGSRRGKSTMLSFTIAQILHQDALASATGIDVKRESFKALFGVPRLTLANNPRNIEEMWQRVHDVRVEMDRRCDARALDASLDFPFKILAIDEVSQFSAQSDALWKSIRPKGSPAHAPVWDDVAALMWQGAAFRCHVILAGQRVDERITGGFGLIGSMGFRGLAGFRKQNWERLIGTYPVQRSRPERGRWVYSDGERETWVQNVWATDSEIKAYAMEPKPSARTLPIAPDPVTGIEWITGIQTAADRLGITQEAFRKRRTRNPIPGEETVGNRPSWPSGTLDQWASRWERASESV